MAFALRDHALARPDAGFSGRLGSLAAAAGQRAAACEAANRDGFEWPATRGGAKPPHELQPGSGRRGPGELWERFDEAVAELDRVSEGRSMRRSGARTPSSRRSPRLSPRPSSARIEPAACSRARPPSAAGPRSSRPPSPHPATSDSLRRRDPSPPVEQSTSRHVERQYPLSGRAALHGRVGGRRRVPHGNPTGTGFLPPPYQPDVGFSPVRLEASAYQRPRSPPRARRRAPRPARMSPAVGGLACRLRRRPRT